MLDKTDLEKTGLAGIGPERIGPVTFGPAKVGQNRGALLEALNRWRRLCFQSRLPQYSVNSLEAG